MTQYKNTLSILSISVTYLNDIEWEFEKHKSDNIKYVVLRAYVCIVKVTVMFKMGYFPLYVRCKVDDFPPGQLESKTSPIPF